MPSVEDEAERKKNGSRYLRNKTWPPLEPLKDYYIRGLRLSLLDRLRILAIVMHRKPVEVANMVIEAGLQAVETEAKGGRS